MILIHVACVSENDSSNILNTLLEAELVYAGYNTSMKGWKRKKDKVHYNFNWIMAGFTKAVLFKDIENYLHQKFPHADFLMYSTPLLNFSGQHAELLKKETK